ncbi:uncharacterized protein LOC105425899 isoform X3 [Pogonomyrmex barbatus]|uniref:Uncharacterized protein LOC105425899 isoform X3 n=1 Tax=Pogonomyrmex barbatus TaxID=144034 RepID=A0A6I9W8Z6_9HYME|nr:uncharacterized protein LOC105425899 isoform X3 [Pogonomyrmex barbatus]XP_025073746.1 uncharacterized protein LOC105425899 isoform X3 [Pogonomyrmex barbatus]
MSLARHNLSTTGADDVYIIMWLNCCTLCCPCAYVTEIQLHFHWKTDTGTMRPHKWMRKTSGSRFEGIDMFQPNEWTHGRARYASEGIMSLFPNNMLSLIDNAADGEARDCRKKNNKNRHRHADSWMLRRQDDTMIIAVSAKVLCYKRRVSLPINVEKRIPESPVSSEFEDTDILLLLTDGNPSKLILDM